MELAFLVYVVETLLPGIVGLLGWTIAITGIMLFVLSFFYYCLMNERDIEMARWDNKTLKNIAKIFVPCCLLMVVLPSKQTTYVMVGAFFTQELLTSDAVTNVLHEGNETVQLFITRTNLQLKDDIAKLDGSTTQTSKE